MLKLQDELGMLSRKGVCTRMAVGARATVFTAVVALLAAACFVLGAMHWQSKDPVHFLCYLAVATMASALKITLPGIDGTMSVSFLFILLAVIEMSLGETLVLGSIAVLVQCYWRPAKRPQVIHILFNISMLTVVTSAAYYIYHIGIQGVLLRWQPLALVTAAITYFLFNTIAMSLVISLTEQKSIQRVWQECYFWSFPYYLVGAGVAEAVAILDKMIGWQASLLVMPAVYLIYRSYKLYLGKLETEKKHVEQMAALHLRTIEALALAIEAKDFITHDHLQRVRVYATELATDLDLSDEEKEALRAAALLHDIGKLAVPEHIISKPGRLTEEEFEKMKIHPIIGAEILEQVEFPYPVVPIVRSHHEKWDGSGYPDGLKGEQIPIGARILSAVDCLDALASDRQYRRALPLHEAMAQVAEEAGKAFDPRVVNMLAHRYVELEKLATEQSRERRAKLSKNIRVSRGAAPATGFATAQHEEATGEQNFLSTIAAAREEGQTIFELTHELGKSLNLQETLSILSDRLKRIVPYDCIAIYLVRDGALHPEFVSGNHAGTLSSLRILLGEGLCGWVAQNRKIVLNGNPAVDAGNTANARRTGGLRSALAVPLEDASGTLGVLALYSATSDAFTSDHLRIVLAISSKLAVVIENTIRYRVAETSAGSDSLSGLLNARSLFAQMEKELDRCGRDSITLGVFLCDFDRFKHINDHLGHLEGNRLLRAFADELKQACREYDCVARMGGDEFVVVAPGLSPQAGSDVIARIADSAERAGSLVCQGYYVSVSVGSAFYPSDGLTTEALLTEADRRMYQAKQERQEKLKPKEHVQSRGAHA
jgi:diguanylate cyclase (GGDEF)-like protein/putative nucleotidyltransferase with HDIG domain